MGFKYVEYDTLSKYIRESIATELKSHDLDEKNLPKALKDLSVSHPKRAIQCKYLLKVLACLDKYGDQKKQKKNVYSMRQLSILGRKFSKVIKEQSLHSFYLPRTVLYIMH